MSEAVAFFGGLIAMAIVWFVHDTKYNPYMRGYAEGLNDGIQEVMKDFPKLRGEHDMKGEQMIEQGVDNYGAEYKRTPNDFSFGFLTQDNCVCNICHGTGAKWKFRYVTRNYQSDRTKRICKTLQAHEHSFWICPKCLQNFIGLTGVQVTVPERRTDERTD